MIWRKIILQGNSLLARPFKQSFMALFKQYFIVLAAGIIHLLIRCICFVPFLIYRGNSYIVSICLYIIVASILRPSFAQSIEKASRNEKFSIKESLCPKSIMENLSFSFSQLISVMLWGIPFIILSGVFYYYYSGGTDFRTMALFIRNIGESLYGSSAGIAEGSMAIMYAFIITILIICIGIARQCGIRYLRMSPIYYSAVPKAEIRRCLAGMRLKQFLVFLVNVLLLIPILYILFSSIHEVYSQTDNILRFIPSITRKRFVVPVMGFMGLWYTTVLPLRRFIDASFASHCRYIRENERSQTR